MFLNLTNLKKSFIVALAGLGVTTSALAASFDDFQKAQIESIIDEYVSNHPEVILRAMKKLG